MDGGSQINLTNTIHVSVFSKLCSAVFLLISIVPSYKFFKFIKTRTLSTKETWNEAVKPDIQWDLAISNCHGQLKIAIVTFKIREFDIARVWLKCYKFQGK